MLSMAMTILGLSIIIFVSNKQEKQQVIVKQTEVIMRQERRYPKIPQFMTTGTYRLRTATKVTSSSILGDIHRTQDAVGSSWGIDLSEYGLPEKRYLMTAAHCIMAHDPKSSGRIADTIEIQIRMERPDEKGKMLPFKKWIKCKALIVDVDVDQALLMAEEEIPVIFKLGDRCDVGSPVIAVGCPIGTTPAAKMGTLVSVDPEVCTPVKCQIWQADVPFYFGNSGGPLFDAESEVVIGSLVAGLGAKEGQLVPNLALVIPCIEIRKMLDYNLRIPEPEEAKAEIVPLVPLVPLVPQKK